MEVGPTKAIVCSLAVAAVLLACKFSRAQIPAPPKEVRTLREWIERTKHPDDAVREKAAIAIGKLGPRARSAVPLLTEMLYDKSWYVREAAAQALERIDPHVKAVGRPPGKLLRREDVLNRHALEIILTKMGPGSKSAAMALAEASTDDDGDVRVAAVEALIRMRADANQAVPVLVMQLKSNTGHIPRRYALTALGKIAPVAKDAVPEMAKLLNDRSLWREVFFALTDLGPAASQALPQLVAAERDYHVLRSAAAKNHTPTRVESVKHVIHWMHCDSVDVRADAQRLWNVLGKEYMPFVVLLLKSDLASDRALAIDKLGDLGQAAIPALVRLLNDHDQDNRRVAIQRLGHIGPAAVIAAAELTPVLKDNDWQLRSAAAISLGQIGADSKEAVTALATSLRDTDGDVRVCAIEALGRIGRAAAPATAGLIERLHDTSPAVRSAAARALGQIGSGAKAGLPELEKLTHDRDDYVRQAANETVKSLTATDVSTKR
jgi:HEAT repeat protein